MQKHMDAATDHSITLISIVVGLGLTELFSNLYRLLRERKRVVWMACRSHGRAFSYSLS
jgi:hypothetical protein